MEPSEAGAAHTAAAPADRLESFARLQAEPLGQRPQCSFDVLGVKRLGLPERLDRLAQDRAAAVELTRELEVFSLGDWTRVLAGLGIADAEGALATLIRANLVMEPKDGFYRAVSLSP